MHILNVTFSIDKSAETPWVTYVQKNIVGKYHDRCLLLRIHSEESTHPSYGMQFSFANNAALHTFKKEQLPTIYVELQKEFPNKWVMFETELEAIAPWVSGLKNT